MLSTPTRTFIRAACVLPLLALIGISDLVLASTVHVPPLGGWHRLSALQPSAVPVFETTGGEIHDIAVSTNGSVYVVGDFTSINGVPRINIARFTPAGDFDPQFAPDLITGTPFAAAMQPDGKLLVAGRMTSIGGLPHDSIARLDEDGALDPTFQTGLGFSSSRCLGADVSSIVVQPDGRILVAGCLTEFDGESAGMIVRLNADGSRDETFSTGTGFNASANALILQPDGRILVGGDFTLYGSAVVGHLARLNPDGSLDTSFNTGTGCDRSVYSMAVQPDGAILVNGIFESYNGTTCDGFVRVSATGARDFGFTPPPGLLSATSMHVLSTGSVLLGGSFYSTLGTIPNRIARIKSDGSLDASFAPGSGFDDDVFTVAVLPDGELLAGGRFRQYAGTATSGLVWLNASGGASSKPSVLLRAEGYVSDVAAAPDGTWLVTGSFDTVNGEPHVALARLHANGSLDTSFIPSAALQDGAAVAVDTTGRVVLAGAHHPAEGHPQPKLVRYLATGALDPGFAEVVFDGYVRALATMPDDTIVACGDFTRVNATSRNHLVRLTADGAVDTAFGSTVRPTERLSALGIQPDGCVLVAGTFLNADDELRARSVRIRPDGTEDPTYQGSAVGQNIKAIAVQPDGRILFGGSSFTNRYEPFGPLERCMPDGSLDTSFDDGAEMADYDGFNGGGISALAVQSDGRIWVAGSFTTYRGISTPGLARLNRDGSLDLEFGPTRKPSSTRAGSAAPLALDLDPHGNLLVAGTWILGEDITSRGAVQLKAATLSNMSVRSSAGRDEKTLIVGFVVTGISTKSMLLRAVGPGLIPLGVSNGLRDPRLTLYQSGRNDPLLTNDNWGGTDALKRLFASVGAFGLVNTSLDAAAAPVLSGGVYTAHATSPDTSGTVLVEAYDVADSSLGDELVNISARSYAGTGDATLILGFVIRGNWSRRLLIRGVGPSLLRLGVTDVLPNPVVTVYRHGTDDPLAYNDNWDGSPEMLATSKKVGAFELDLRSADAAAVVVLPPGVYTAHVSARHGGSGVALVEAYLVD